MCRAPVAAVKLLRDVGTVTGDVVRGEAIGAGYVFTVDNFLKMLSITLRLEVKRVLGILGVSRPTRTYSCTFFYDAMFRCVPFSFERVVNWIKIVVVGPCWSPPSFDIWQPLDTNLSKIDHMLL